MGQDVSIAAIDSYGAPAADVIGSGSELSPAVSAGDEYGAPAAPVIDSAPSVQNEAFSAPDSYGAPQADVIGSSPSNAVAAVSPVDSYEVSPSEEVLVLDEALIQDNSISDSYGTPKDPAPSSYDAPAVPAGYAF